jgi:hypothetical protein
MNLAHFIHANELVAMGASGEMTLSELEHELIMLAMDIDPRAERSLDRFIGSAIIVLSEMDRGDRSIESVTSELKRIAKHGQSLMRTAAPITPPSVSTSGPLVDRIGSSPESATITNRPLLRTIRQAIQPLLGSAQAHSTLRFG